MSRLSFVHFVIECQHSDAESQPPDVASKLQPEIVAFMLCGSVLTLFQVCHANWASAQQLVPTLLAQTWR